MLDSTNDVSRVLIIYTGGTIGMKMSDRGFVPAKGYLASKLAGMPQFHDASAVGTGTTTHVMPCSSHDRHVGYDILEYDPLLDSCNLSDEDWGRVAKDIEKHYKQYDAFVVLHGTDTMAYTASALSFMLPGLSKTVVITGSQIPLSQPRNDGAGNLEGALFVAGHYVIPEVSLYFSNKLYRGNRTTKADASKLAAFESPNFPPLASVGISVDVNWHLVNTPKATDAFAANTAFDKEVAVVQLFPGMSTESLKRQLAAPLRGAVLRTYGAGNAPDGNDKFLAALRSASDAGVIIINTTQCWHGTVEGHYATGVALAEAGVIAGRDMTPETALVKMGWLLGQGKSVDEVRALMSQNIRGDLTPKADTLFSLNDSGFIHNVYAVMKENSTDSSNGKNLKMIKDALLPTLFCSAASMGATGEIQSMLQDGADVESADYDGRTGLHLAASTGHEDVVSLMLAKGANVNAVDRWGATPLVDSIKHNHGDCTDTLLEAGGALLIDDADLASLLCRLAQEQDLATLETYLRCGANPNAADYDGRTALHIAASTGHKDITSLILQKGADVNAVDRFASTPLLDAIKHAHADCVDVLLTAGGKLMMKKHEAASTLCRLAQEQDLATLETYLRCGADPNTADYDGRTALHLAASGHKDVTALLLKKGAEVNVVDRFGSTPLLDAVKNDHTECIDVLLTAGGKLMMQDHEAASTLCRLAQAGECKALSRYLRCGANPNAADYDGRTALHLAASSDCPESVEVLLANGAEINSKDRWGVTPLEEAAVHQKTACGDILTKAGGIRSAARAVVSEA